MLGASGHRSESQQEPSGSAAGAADPRSPGSKRYIAPSSADGAAVEHRDENGLPLLGGATQNPVVGLTPK